MPLLRMLGLTRRSLSLVEIGATVTSTVAVLLLTLLACAGLESLAGTAIGNSGGDHLERQAHRDMAAVMVHVLLKAPVFEEVAFRWPGLLVLGVWGLFARPPTLVVVGMGILIAGGFALGHGLDMLPLPQFLAGLWFWYCGCKHGLSHAILAHITWNGTLVLFWLPGTF